MEDFIPEIIAFSVDFLSALFVSACISASGPIYLSVLFIGADIGQVMLEFREVRANAHTVVNFFNSHKTPNQIMILWRKYSLWLEILILIA